MKVSTRAGRTNYWENFGDTGAWAAMRRRQVLLLALAAAGCGRRRVARPVAAAPVVEFAVAVDAEQAPAPAPAHGATDDVGRVQAQGQATGEWFQPVVAAFNAQHRTLKARYAAAETVVPQGTRFTVEGTPGISVWLGSAPASGQDLTAAVRNANLDLSVLAPGTLPAVTDGSGKLRGLPLDYSVTAMQYAPARLQSAGVQPPPLDGWTADAFASAVATLDGRGRRETIFGEGLSHSYGDIPVWLGFAEGYGGSVWSAGRFTLTTPEVLEGLQRYAEILAMAWVGDIAYVPPAWIRFDWFNAAAGTDPAGGVRWSRFPRMPVVPVVPAQVVAAQVPLHAPQADAGGVFVAWLLSQTGQQALASIGFPVVRTDLPQPETWLAKRAAIPDLDHLRFLPLAVWLAGLRSRDMIGALIQPPSARLAALRALEDNVNSGLEAPKTTPAPTR